MQLHAQYVTPESRPYLSCEGANLPDYFLTLTVTIAYALVHSTRQDRGV